ncbi:MAG: histidine phosphatase family protein [Geobacteraceae bacterium]|nr:histidine phosphatase family protein [Geobacteraceae bacterium]
MKVHFIRHAQAIERSTDLPDELRNLTCRGRKRFRKVAATFRKIDISPDIIVTSPKIRAVQTAEILSETIRFSGELKVLPELGENPGMATLSTILNSYSMAGDIVIVGHEPWLGELIGKLLSIKSIPYLPKGCVVSLKIFSGKSEISAELTGMITGSGKSINRSASAAERLFTKRDLAANNGTEAGSETFPEKGDPNGKRSKT